MEIRTVIFDLDDTLIVDEAVSHDAVEATADHAFAEFAVDRERFLRDAKSESRRLWADSPVHPYCRRIGISAFECLWGRFEGDQPEIVALREWAHPFRRAVVDAALRQQNIEAGDTVDAIVATFESRRRSLQRLMPNARETLARLKPHCRLGLLTNGAPDLQREKLAASGLAGFFDAVAISGEHGIGKPDPEIFCRLLRELDADPATSAMVGNSLERDIAGAKNAGILAIWLRVAGSEEHADVTPDFTIDGLAELPDLLDSPKNDPAAI